MVASAIPLGRFGRPDEVANAPGGFDISWKNYRVVEVQAALLCVDESRPQPLSMLTYHADQLYAELPDRWDGQFEGRGPPG